MTGARPVRAVRITPDGTLELVDVHPDPAHIAQAVDGVGPSDVTARATWPPPDPDVPDVLTVWTAKSARRSRVNELAARVVTELLPRLPGHTDRVWERVHDDPIAGPALVTGYRPRTGTEPGATVDLSEQAVGRIRSIVGRSMRRDAPTVAVPATPATTPVPVLPGIPPERPQPPKGARRPVKKTATR